MTRTLLSLLCALTLAVALTACGGDDPVVRPRYEAVDLGLSVKWANMNLAASEPANYGRLMGWADSTGQHTTFDGIALSFTSTGGKLQTNCQWNSGYYGGNTPPANIAGTDFDPARYMFNTNWRIPTLTQWQELIDRCTWTTETLNGNTVIRATGPNGKSIIFPVAGIQTREPTNSGDPTALVSTTDYREQIAFYWTANLLSPTQQADYGFNSNRACAAWAVQFDLSSDTRPVAAPQVRCYRLSVRAVCN